MKKDTTESSLKLLRSILKDCRKIDFKEEAILNYGKTNNNKNFKSISAVDKSNFKLENKHYIIITIDHFLKLMSKNKIRLSKRNDSIYLFNGVFWEIIDKSLVKHLLRLVALKFGVPALIGKYFQFIEELYKQFEVSSFIPNKEDSDIILINFLNGTLEINGAETIIREFRAEDFLTNQLPFIYDPNATSEIFKKFLDEVIPDINSQMVLSEFIGSIFIKNNNSLKLEKALILLGSGSNGKSVFFEVLSSLLGSQNISNYSLSSLTDNTGYSRAQIQNYLLNYSSEISKNMNVTNFKQLSSGEPIEARNPYGQPFMIKNYAKLAFNTNTLPTDVESTKAFFRRFLIIPFNVTISEKDQDRELHSKIIEAELSGVFNWVLLGLGRITSQKGFTPCDIIDETIKKYENESDTVKLFLQEQDYIPSAVEYIKIVDLYKQYRLFCLEDGYYPSNKSIFIKSLKSSKINIEKKNVGNVAFIQINPKS